jgi:hypothetical protein
VISIEGAMIKFQDLPEYKAYKEAIAKAELAKFHYENAKAVEKRCKDQLGLAVCKWKPGSIVIYTEYRRGKTHEIPAVVEEYSPFVSEYADKNTPSPAYKLRKLKRDGSKSSVWCNRGYYVIESKLKGPEEKNV